MSEISIKKLVYIIEHQDCSGVECLSENEGACPLFIASCHYPIHEMSLQDKIAKAMEHYGITKADLMEYLVGKQSSGEG